MLRLRFRYRAFVCRMFHSAYQSPWSEWSESIQRELRPTYRIRTRVCRRCGMMSYVAMTDYAILARGEFSGNG